MFELREILIVDSLLQAYLLLMVADFITGFLKAWKTEGFKSRKIRDGIIRVIGEMVGLVVCGILDIIFSSVYPIIPPGTVLVAVKVLFIFKEFVSIAENLGIIGVELPKFISEHLEELKDKAVKSADKRVNEIGVNVENEDEEV